MKTLQFAVQSQYSECKLFFHNFKCSCVSCAERYSTKSESLIFYIMLAAFKVLSEMDSSLFFGAFFPTFIMSSLPAVNWPLSKRNFATYFSTRFQSFIFNIFEHAKGHIKPKSRLASSRFFQKNRTDKFDLFAVKSKKANKTNLSVRFLGEVSRP